LIFGGASRLPAPINSSHAFSNFVGQFKRI